MEMKITNDSRKLAMIRDELPPAELDAVIQFLHSTLFFNIIATILTTIAVGGHLTSILGFAASTLNTSTAKRRCFIALSVSESFRSVFNCLRFFVDFSTPQMFEEADIYFMQLERPCLLDIITNLVNTIHGISSSMLLLTAIEPTNNLKIILPSIVLVQFSIGALSFTPAIFKHHLIERYFTFSPVVSGWCALLSGNQTAIIVQQSLQFVFGFILPLTCAALVAICYAKFGTLAVAIIDLLLHLARRLTHLQGKSTSSSSHSAQIAWQLLTFMAPCCSAFITCLPVLWRLNHRQQR